MIPVVRRPIVITTANQGIRITEGATTATANVAPGTYYLRTTGANAIGPAIKAALEAATASTNTYAIGISPSTLQTVGGPTAVVTITRGTGSDDLTLLLGAAQTTFPVEAIGYERTTYGPTFNFSSGKSPTGWWQGGGTLAVDEHDSEGEVFGESPAAGGQYLPGSLSSVWETLLWEIDLCDQGRTLEDRNPSDPQASWQSLWRFLRDGPAVELARINPALSTVFESSAVQVPGLWYLDQLGRERLGVNRLGPGLGLYSWRMRWHKKVGT